MQIGRLQRFHRIGHAALPCSRARCGHHPLRILVAELIQAGIVRDLVIEAAERVIQGSLRDVPVHAILTNRDRARIGIHSRRRIVEDDLACGKSHKESRVAR